MLYVLLLLLKILGILLLLFIGLVLLVLLTPIQYSFELEKEEQREPKFMVRVTWLFWLFYFKTSYIEKVFDYRIRILGYQIAGNQPEFLEKQKERQKKKSQKEKAKEAAPDLVLELPKEKENSASDSEETVSGMDEATQNEDIPEKKGILIAIDPGHQAPDVDMSAKEPNAPGSNVMKAKATGGTSGRYSGIAEYELNLAISLMLREALQNEGYDVIMTREDNETAISNAERATMANDAGADIAIRIHANGSENSSANGALVLIGSAGNPYV